MSGELEVSDDGTTLERLAVEVEVRSLDAGDFLRNHDAFAYNKDNPNSGYSYKDAPPRTDFGPPSVLEDDSGNP